MKIIRNGICYIESEDIEFLETIPQSILLERKANISYSPIFNFEKYTQEQSVLYFKENECIIDYDSVCNLSSDELDITIQEIEEQLNKYTSISVSASSATKKKLDQTQEYNSGVKKLKYILKSLKNYKTNKSSYDRVICDLNFKAKIKKVPLNYQSACAKTDPKAKIPVSSSNIEELDRSIQFKCKQNAIERQKSVEIAKNYIVGAEVISTYQKQIGKRK